MTLMQLDTLKACERLKDYFLDGGIISDNGIKEEHHVYVGSFPTSGLPKSFIFIAPNGSPRDEFDIARTTLMVGILTEYVDAMPNKEKIDIILAKVSAILSKKITDKDYEFRVHAKSTINTGTSLANGYAMTLINVFCIIKSR